MVYLGIDAHTNNSYLHAIDEDGNTRYSGWIATTREAFVSAIAALPAAPSAVLESGYCWAAVYDWIEPHCAAVLLADPAKTRFWGERVIKTDRIDAQALALLLRQGCVPWIYAPSAAERSLRRTLRHRIALVRTRTMARNRVHALIVAHGLRQPPLSDLFGASGLGWLRELALPTPDDEVLLAELELLGRLEQLLAEADDRVREAARGDEAVSLLRSVPGVGAFLSVLIRAEIADIERFASAKRLVSYSGLAPATYSSAGRTRHGRLARNCNHWLRWAFGEAVTAAVRCNATLRAHYAGVKSRRGAADARMATARKIATLVWHVWKETRPYEQR